MEKTISGVMLRDMLLAGAALLERNKAYIDSLNVFPVPDGDTGTNMSMTMQGAVHELKALGSSITVAEVAKAVSLGSLKGARGNSGVILSQVFRGFSKALAGASEMDAQMFANALRTGTEAAYKAVMKPKEGTMLTVVREISEAVEAAVASGTNAYDLIDVILESGETSLKLTPELLPVLKEAGVVDSGGKGLLTIFHGFKMALDGEDIVDFLDAPAGAQAEEDEAQGALVESAEDIEFGYCTEFFIIHLIDSFTETDLDRLREKLMKIGDSVVVAHDTGFIKVHVHSNYPGKILQLALRLGEVDKVKIENMREQNREIQDNLKKNEKEIAMVAVSSGSGICEVFDQLAVAVTIQGGQTMNPSIDVIVKAIRRANAKNVLVLPNNSNIIMAAQQAAALVDTNVIVIPSKSMVQGIAAATAFDFDADAETNAKNMTDALETVVSGSVTYAVRDTQYNGAHIETGNIIGLINNKIVEVGTDISDTSKSLLRQMIATHPDDPVVTVFYGEDVSEADANAFVSDMEEEFPDAEFAVQNGNQPLYYYYLSVE